MNYYGSRPDMTGNRVPNLNLGALNPAQSMDLQSQLQKIKGNQADDPSKMQQSIRGGL